ncbi:hypothetical protein BD410DRAFT_788150 [Rickenella mellea]|uniref:Uncharacterized protein n=1 Tax=Rickenella mellea TaxID=50990 RepID=A0A4Y7Q660_9AGAM|nr:hypothetical protein BD410DRAFT_788150 [Rickenella mellea]
MPKMPISLDFDISLPSEHLSSAEEDLSEASFFLKKSKDNDSVKADFARRIDKAQEKLEIEKGKIWSFGSKQLAKEAKDLRQTISMRHIDSFPNSTPSSSIATETGDAGGNSDTKDCPSGPGRYPQSPSCPSQNTHANSPDVCMIGVENQTQNAYPSSSLHPSSWEEARSAIHNLRQSGQTDLAFNRRHSMVQLPLAHSGRAVLARSKSARLATPRLESLSPSGANPWDGRSNHYDTNSPGNYFVGGFWFPPHDYIRASGLHPHATNAAAFLEPTYYQHQTALFPSSPLTPKLRPSEHAALPHSPISPLPGPSYALYQPPEPCFRYSTSTVELSDDSQITFEEHLQDTDEKHPPPPPPPYTPY